MNLFAVSDDEEDLLNWLNDWQSTKYDVRVVETVYNISISRHRLNGISEALNESVEINENHANQGRHYFSYSIKFYSIFNVLKFS